MRQMVFGYFITIDQSAANTSKSYSRNELPSLLLTSRKNSIEILQWLSNFKFTSLSTDPRHDAAELEEGFAARAPVLGDHHRVIKERDKPSMIRPGRSDGYHHEFMTCLSTLCL